LDVADFLCTGVDETFSHDIERGEGVDREGVVVDRAASALLTALAGEGRGHLVDGSEP
jgi:hypothetical protein